LIAVERFCARLATHLIFVSEDNRQEAFALGIGRNIPNSLIRSGIEIEPATWKGSERRARDGAGMLNDYDAPADAWVATYVGNFKLQKNPIDLVKTAERAIAKDPQLYFVLIGDGELKEPVRRYAKEHGIEKQIKLL